ncbi:MAG TPA: MBL fold metallo-hydrolase [Frankiaceae bacterium]
MLIAGFPAGAYGTNCWVVAPGPGERCIVIDPGHEATGPLEDLLRQHHLQPAAVLLTHGHLDHTWSVVPVCGARDIPAYIHPDDRGQLTDPQSWLGLPPGTPFFGRTDFTEPSDVRLLADGDTLDLAGVRLRVDLAPGHTPGSVTFSGQDDGGVPRLFSGDLLFAGSVGRTDLPGGSSAALLDSLARVCLALPDETVVHPGHGPDTTIGQERVSNPFLLGLSPEQQRRTGL